MARRGQSRPNLLQEIVKREVGIARRAGVPRTNSKLMYLEIMCAREIVRSFSLPERVAETAVALIGQIMTVNPFIEKAKSGKGVLRRRLSHFLEKQQAIINRTIKLTKGRSVSVETAARLKVDIASLQRKAEDSRGKNIKLSEQDIKILQGLLRFGNTNFNRILGEENRRVFSDMLARIQGHIVSLF